MTQYQVLGARRSADRVGRHEAEPVECAFSVVGVKKLWAAANRRKSSSVIGVAKCCLQPWGAAA
jgi:hypothetical protein